MDKLELIYIVQSYIARLEIEKIETEKQLKGTVKNEMDYTTKYLKMVIELIEGKQRRANNILRELLLEERTPNNDCK